MLDVHVETERTLAGQLMFSPRFVGTSSVHGGAVALFFDDLLGRLANHGAGPLVRTAGLRIDFRDPTPVSVVLDCDAKVERVDGRKRVLRGTVRHETTLLAEAEGLWIEPRRENKEST